MKKLSYRDYVIGYLVGGVIVYSIFYKNVSSEKDFQLIFSGKKYQCQLKESIK